jgi:septum site-determining protein MinC
MAAGSAAAQAGVELKFGQVGVASVCLREADPGVLLAELALRIDAAPDLFRRAPLILDLSRLPALPDAEQARALLDAARSAGMLPVGLSYGTAENEQLAQMLNLPLFAKFRIAPEFSGARAAGAARPPSAAAPPAAITGLHHAKPVRSGQQVYARGRDLTVAAAVGSGAEVIADGSIHVYGRLSGRALAGALGDTTARIYCQDFQAEFVSIAGHYRVLEDVPADLRGKPVQAWLDGERLVLEKL